MNRLTEPEWYDLGKDHRRVKQSIRNDNLSPTIRLNRLQSTFGKIMVQVSDNLDTIVNEQYPHHTIELPGYGGSYLTELFYITDKDDQIEVISDPVQLQAFAINYLDRMNHIVYNNKKNFNILKNNIRKICESF